MKTLQIKDDVRRIAERLKALVSARLKVHDVVVFGSRARGDASVDSDLDVLIVVEYLDHAAEKFISDCAWEAGFADDIVVVPVTISRTTLTETPLKESVFIKNVYREGIAV